MSFDRNAYMQEYKKKYYNGSESDESRALRMLNSRKRFLKAQYGMTLETYDAMFDDQDGLCAICGNPEPVITKAGVRRSLSVDHCHETDQVRSLLCSKCNVGIGLLQDDSELLRAAAAYVDRHAGMVKQLTKEP